MPSIRCCTAASLSVWVGRLGIRPRARATRDGPSPRSAGRGSAATVPVEVPCNVDAQATKPPEDEDEATRPRIEEARTVKRDAGSVRAPCRIPLLRVGDNAVEATAVREVPVRLGSGCALVL